MKWISVEDRLPNSNQTELFLVRQYRYRDADAREKYGHEKVTQLRWRNPGDNKFLGESTHNPVTHWMPLPPPPGDEQ